MIRVVVTGGRNYSNDSCYKTVYSVFSRITDKYGASNLSLVCGMARGADSLAWQCANALAWRNVEEYPADWNKYGNAAGHIRNREMALSRPAFCVAFPGGRGTTDMIRRCERYSIPVYRFG